MQVGLAVGDTETMKKYATIKRLGMQLEYLIEIEESYPKFITRAVYQVVHIEKPNKTPRLHRFEISLSVFTSDHFIVCHSIRHCSASGLIFLPLKKKQKQKLAVS